MTGINGKTWLTEIKKTEGLKDIPVVIYSGSKNPDDIEQAREKGATFYLPKPVRVSELKRSLSNLFEKKQRQFLFSPV